jgi:hypothetical protein
LLLPAASGNTEAQFLGKVNHMDTNIRQVTQGIIKQVEEVSGFPVEVIPDRSLKTYATVRMARGGIDRHIISYNPGVASQPDYLIAYQCGFIIRKFSVPPAERKEFAVLDSGKADVRRMLKGIPSSLMDAMTEQIYTGIMLQLRSFPTGLRVDDWILTNYPELSSLQNASIARQLGDNTQVLKPEIKRMSPPRIYDANVSMNGAFAIYWAKAAGDDSIALSYKSTAYFSASEQLMELWQEIPSDPSSDCRLIDSWGEYLGLSGWYQWISAE